MKPQEMALDTCHLEIKRLRSEWSDLYAQVEGLTAERDHYRVGMAKAKAELARLQIREVTFAEQHRGLTAELARLREGIAGLPRHEIYIGATEDDQFDGLYVAAADLAALLEVPREQP